MKPTDAAAVARIALFAALIYVLSWVTYFIPNVNLLFFVVFLAGYLWGYLTGMLIGAIGMGLWTMFNPFGPSMFPIMLAQIIGAALVAGVGSAFRKYKIHLKKRMLVYINLILAAFVSTLIYFLLVSAADAYVFQPFWPRFISGMLWSLISLISNMIIFPLLFPLLTPLIKREMSGQ